MKVNPVNLILIVCFISPLILGFINRFNSEDVKEEILDIQKSILLLGTIIFTVSAISKFDLLDIIIEYLRNLSNGISMFFDNYPQISYYGVFLILNYVIYNIFILLISIINSITIDPILNQLQRYSLRKGEVFRGIIGFIFAIPKAIAITIVICIGLNLLTYFKITSEYNNYINTSTIYRTVSEKVINAITNSPFVKEIPRVLNNSLKINVVKVNEGNSKQNSEKEIFSREIIYYNGVTLEEGIKSNKEIDSLAQKLTRFKSSDKEKARVLYSWIGTNIEYDDNKANEILRNNFKVQSGAIPTFESKKGICFDYSCLYVSMARASGLKVRMVVGEGFNGRQWVNHAWNEVYIKEENRWIRVDSTFYKAGNYFDSKRFEKDHRSEKVAGEW
ncbi:transglutaminase domain protein [Clostridium polyendosporum]|uniref:Transglutaminase domain protein n=1 Tax=Clostridium polyendosporum TaxID=69208 RepID=A0A919S019_9CLOT|nr:transglutaminase-like domain-containing protein [Clostridium polyendosporum]GIM28660.1 transglutaminase domain protein [Clostridium polyendosporum]